MIAPLPIPAPGFADVQGSQVRFTPPGANVPIIPTGKKWNVQPLGDGRADLCAADGGKWGIFANEQVARETAERLSR